MSFYKRNFSTLSPIIYSPNSYEQYLFLMLADGEQHSDKWETSPFYKVDMLLWYIILHCLYISIYTV